MRRILLSVMFILVAAAASAQERYVSSPGDGYLNLRTGPGTGYAIITEMYHRDVVQVLERPGSWWRVFHYESGREGWAFSRNLQSSVPRLVVYSANDGYLNLRSGPGTGYAILRRMYNFEPVEVYGRSGVWLRVEHASGATGWAHSRWLVSP